MYVQMGFTTLAVENRRYRCFSYPAQCPVLAGKINKAALAGYVTDDNFLRLLVLKRWLLNASPPAFSKTSKAILLICMNETRTKKRLPRRECFGTMTMTSPLWKSNISQRTLLIRTSIQQTKCGNSVQQKNKHYEQSMSKKHFKHIINAAYSLEPFLETSSGTEAYPRPPHLHVPEKDYSAQDLVNICCLVVCGREFAVDTLFVQKRKPNSLCALTPIFSRRI
jgi:hypothetical protein